MSHGSYRSYGTYHRVNFRKYGYITLRFSRVYEGATAVAETWRVSRLDVNIKYVEDIPVIEAKGEADLITSRKLKDAADSLVSTGHCKIAFDLRNMTYIDSSGFRVLLEAKTKVSQMNGDIALVSMTAPVERVFNLLRLNELIICTDTIEEAVKKLKTRNCKQ